LLSRFDALGAVGHPDVGDYGVRQQPVDRSDQVRGRADGLANLDLSGVG